MPTWYHIHDNDVDYRVFDRGRLDPVVTLVGSVTRTGPPFRNSEQRYAGTISIDRNGLSDEKVLRMLENYLATEIMLFPEGSSGESATKALLGPRVRLTVYPDHNHALDTLINPSKSSPLESPPTFLTTQQTLFSFRVDRAQLEKHLQTVGSYTPLRLEIAHRKTPYRIVHDFLYRVHHGLVESSRHHTPQPNAHSSLVSLESLMDSSSGYVPEAFLPFIFPEVLSN